MGTHGVDDPFGSGEEGVPSDASTSTTKVPSAPIPHDVREARYSGQPDIGLAILVSVIQCPAGCRW